MIIRSYNLVFTPWDAQFDMPSYVKTSTHRSILRLGTTLREQFRFSGALRRHKVALAILFIAMFILPSAPGLYRAYQHAQAGPYCERINPKLVADPRFQNVHAWKTLKHTRYTLSFSGSVRSQNDLESLRKYIATTAPPGEYSIGVWVDSPR